MITTGPISGGVPPRAPAATPPALSGSVALPQGVSVPFADAISAVEQHGSAGVTIAPPIAGNRLQLLIDEHQALPEMLSAISGAKQQVDLAMFSFDPSGAGRQVADLLIDKARSGVEVNVQVDQVGSMVLPLASGTSFMDELASAGIRVRVNPRLTLSDGVRPVDHRKVLIVDGETCFTGGMNLSAKFGTWHDVMARIDGPAAARMGVELLGRWVDEGGTISDAQRYTLLRGAEAREQGAASVSILTNKPGGEHHASDFLLSSIAAARQRVWMLTPTLSNSAVVDAIIGAAQRGVDVRVGISGREGWIGTRALGVIGSAFYEDLVRGGVKLYEQPGMSHAKVSLVDDVALVGSMNLTRRAMLWDHETGIASDDPAFRGQLQQMLERDLSQGRRIGMDDAARILARGARAVRRATGLQW